MLVGNGQRTQLGAFGVRTGGQLSGDVGEETSYGVPSSTATGATVAPQPRGKPESATRNESVGVALRTAKGRAASPGAQR